MVESMHAIDHCDSICYGLALVLRTYQPHVVPALHQTQMIELQLGPPPPVTASTGMQLQYAQLKRMRIRTHIIDNLLGIIESLTTVAVKVGNVMNSTAVTARLCL